MPRIARYVSTDGQVFSDPDPRADARIPALKASGAHDLACPLDQVDARVLSTDRGKPLYVADGCGRRAIYANVWRESPPSSPSVVESIYDCTLTSILPLSPAPGP